MEEMEVYDTLFSSVRFDNIPLSHMEGVIVEPRRHKHLGLVLRNFRYMLPEWSLSIYHSRDNKEYIEEILGPSHNVRMICISDANISIEEYSLLLLCKEFWHNMRGEKILIFQTDSFIRKREGIYSFIGYDYVGAPWRDDFLSIQIDRDGISQRHSLRVGNGGISLRTKRVMIQILELECMKEYLHLPEDIFFSIGMLVLGDKVRACPPEVAKHFSVETIYCHNPYVWHKAYYYWKGKEWNHLKTLEI